MPDITKEEAGTEIQGGGGTSYAQARHEILVSDIAARLEKQEADEEIPVEEGEPEKEAAAPEKQEAAATEPGKEPAAKVEAKAAVPAPQVPEPQKVVTEESLAVARMQSQLAEAQAQLKAAQEKASLAERLAAAKDDPAALLDLIEEVVPREQITAFFMKAGTPKDRELERVRKEAQAAKQSVAQLQESLQSAEVQRMQAAAIARAEQEFVQELDAAKDKYPRVAAIGAERAVTFGHAVAEALTSSGKSWSYHDILGILEEELGKLGPAAPAPVAKAEPAGEEDQKQKRAAKLAAKHARPVSSAEAGVSSGKSSGVTNGARRRSTIDERVADILGKVGG